MFRKKRLKSWIGGFVLGTSLIESVYLLIPKNLGGLLEKDYNL